MKFLQSLSVLLGVASFATALVPREAAPQDTHQLDERARGCTNDRKHRNCWYGRFDINTDYENEWPNTGRTRRVRTRLYQVNKTNASYSTL